jgi:hypothetical protein
MRGQEDEGEEPDDTGEGAVDIRDTGRLAHRPGRPTRCPGGTVMTSAKRT